MPYRIEVTRLDGPKRTPQGGLRAEAALTRTGIFVYRRQDGSEVREYRPPEEVFKADSLATLVAAPVTRLHPPELVSSENFGRYAKGHIGESVRQDGDKVVASVFVQEAGLVSAVERGDMREVSCGYTCRMDDTPGVSPEGERYDRVQRDISYNHVAVVPVGRGGSDVRLRLDAADDVVRLDAAEEKAMKVERIDGVEYEIGSDAYKAAEKRRDEATAAAKVAADKLAARADAAEAELAKAKQQLLESQDEKRFDAEVAKRITLIQSARSVLGAEAKLDGKPVGDIKREVVAKAFGEIRLDGKSEAYVDGLFDAALAKHEAVGVAKVAETALRADEGTDPVEAARKRLNERTQNAWQAKA